MVSGLDWVGLGGSVAVVGVNYLRWGVCTLEHLEFTSGIILFYEVVIIVISLFGGVYRICDRCLL